jgi:hypothetical protein
MSFPRHEEIYRSDGFSKAEAGRRLPLVGPGAQQKDATEGARPAHRPR